MDSDELDSESEDEEEEDVEDDEEEDEVVDEADELLFAGAEGGGDGGASCGMVEQLLLAFSSMATEATCGSDSKIGRCPSDLSTTFPSQADSSSLETGASTETRAGKGLEEAEEEDGGDSDLTFTEEGEPA